MGDIIVCCTCSGVRERSKSAFKILYKDMEMPEMAVGKDSIRKKIEVFPKESNMAQHLQAITKKGGKFSYYIKYDDELNIVEMMDLLKGKKVY